MLYRSTIASIEEVDGRFSGRVASFEDAMVLLMERPSQKEVDTRDAGGPRRIAHAICEREYGQGE